MNYAILSLYALQALTFYMILQDRAQAAREREISRLEREAERVRMALDMAAWVETLPALARRQAF